METHLFHPKCAIGKYEASSWDLCDKNVRNQMSVAGRVEPPETRKECETDLAFCAVVDTHDFS